jgi:hypothetical protein
MLTVTCTSDGVNPSTWEIPEGVAVAFVGPDWDSNLTLEGPHSGPLPEPPCPYDGDGCEGGILWPMATNGDSTHDWIERCDECQRFDSDRDAAIALGQKLGQHIKWGTIPGVSGKCPYIDKEE